MKKNISLAIAFVYSVCFLLSLSGCAPKSGSDIVRFALDWTPNTNHTGLYVAQEKGYFAQEGLNVEILQPPENGAVALLASGGADFAVDFQESLGPAIAREDPLPVLAVAAIISHNTSGVLSLKESDIQTPRDLMGKRFATWSAPLVDAIIRQIVEADGGRFEEVDMIPNWATDAISALQTDIDAIWVYYAWDGIAAELHGVETNFMDFSELNTVFDFYTPVILTNTDYAAAQPEEVKAFLRALSRGYAYASENPKEAAAILCGRAPELDPELVSRSQDYLATRYQDDAPRWGEIDAARWDAFYGWMYQEGLLDIDIRGMGFSNEYLP